MEPRHYAVDKRAGRQCPRVHVLASMEPRHYAVDKAEFRPSTDPIIAASMEPRHYAVDKGGAIANILHNIRELQWSHGITPWIRKNA